MLVRRQTANSLTLLSKSVLTACENRPFDGRKIDCLTTCDNSADLTGNLRQTAVRKAGRRDLSRLREVGRVHVSRR